MRQRSEMERANAGWWLDASSWRTKSQERMEQEDGTRRWGEWGESERYLRRANDRFCSSHLQFLKLDSWIPVKMCGSFCIPFPSGFSFWAFVFWALLGPSTAPRLLDCKISPSELLGDLTSCHNHAMWVLYRCWIAHNVFFLMMYCEAIDVVSC